MRVIQIISITIIIAGLLNACAISETNRRHVTLEWTTGTEVDTAGFNLYRSNSENGTYTKINPNLIPASNDPVVGGKYRYDDLDVTPGQTYFYQLEDVELTGKTTRHTPIKIAVANDWSSIVLAFALVLLALLISLIWLVRKRQ